jgi:hypothetical protein
LQNWIQVPVDSPSQDQESYFQVDLGLVKMQFQSLLVSSSLIKPGPTLRARFVGPGVYGDSAAEQNEIYALGSDTVISLTFNMPVDVAYAENFIEFYDPKGAAVPFTGSWDGTGTIYSIRPDNSLAQDNNDMSQYTLAIARPVRSFTPAAFGARSELSNVRFLFHVLAPNRDPLIAAQAPTFYPQGENQGYSSYTFDNDRIKKIGLVPNTTMTDVRADEYDICLRYNLSTSAVEYKYWFINRKDNQAGNWQEIDAATFFTSEHTELGDGTAYRCTVNIFTHATNLFGADQRMTAGEEALLVVTAVDKDGNTASINSVESPLLIEDTWAPTIVSVNPSYVKTLVPGEIDEAFSWSPSGRVTVNFHERMDTALAASKPLVAALSGLFSGLNTIGARYLSTTSWEADLRPTFKVASTTLARGAVSGNNFIYVSSISSFRVGDVIRLRDSVSRKTEVLTISQINSYASSVTFTSSLTNSYPSGSSVFLNSGSGNTASLTAFVGTTFIRAFRNDRSVTLSSGQGGRFFVDQTVKFYYAEEEGWKDSGVTKTIASISSDTVTFTSVLGADIPAGAQMVDSAVGLGEVQPRAASPLTPSLDLLLDGTAASTVTEINNFATTPDAQADDILVTSVSNLHVNDLVTIGATPVSATTSSLTAIGATTLSFSSHSFLVGDEVLITRPAIRVNLSSAASSGANTIFLSSAQNIVSSETMQINDDQFESHLTSVVSAGSTSLLVASSSGLAVGQTISIDSGVEAAETRIISSISGSTVGITAALTNAHGIGARVVRNVLTQTITASANISSATLTISGSLTNPYSGSAYITKDTFVFRRAVTGVAPTSITINTGSDAGVGLPAGTTVDLLTLPESRRISAINGRLVTLASALSFSHRKGASVEKLPQGTLYASGLANVVMGDTIICDSYGLANLDQSLDRFTGTVIGFDTQSNALTFSTTKTGFIRNENLSCTHMGDAIELSGARDHNGNTIRNSWGYRQDLSTSGASTAR